MSLHASIKGHGASILIEVSGYERPATQDAYDANWLKCHVAINLGYFTGEYPAAFMTSDFVRFRDDLKKILSTMDGLASFETCEEALNCTIEMRGSGTARIQGGAQVQQSIAATLSFSFESDQSFVTQTMREVEAIIAQYPVRVEPGKAR
jgi:hypothetical protein